MPRISLIFIFTMSIFKKAQADPRELVLTIIIAASLAIVGVLVFSTVANTSDNLFDPTRLTEKNESITITVSLPTGDNSTLLAKAGYIANSETVRNKSSPNTALTRNTDYKITNQVASSGVLTSRGNFTLIDLVRPSGFNDTELLITYNHNVESDAQGSVNIVESTVLDAFELGMISLIVLAAVVILAVLFRLGG